MGAELTTSKGAEHAPAPSAAMSSQTPGRQTQVSNGPDAAPAESSRAGTPGSSSPAQHIGSTQAAFGGEQSRITNIPAEVYVIPFDSNPKSSPGEQILFAASYTDQAPGDYQIVYTVAGGDLDAKGSGTKTKTIAGINASNIAFFIDAAWNKATAVTAKMELQKVSDKTVLKSKSWNFTDRGVAPTKTDQIEGEGEFPNPKVYSYQVGPHEAGKDSFIGQTILEKFGAVTGNLVVADVKPAYAQTHGLDTDVKVNNHFFPWGSGNNGTFTVSAGDKIYDQHGGMTPKASLDAGLAAPKQFEVDTLQVYEAEPGKAIGKYTIKRILKVDGSSVIKKFKTP